MGSVGRSQQKQERFLYDSFFIERLLNVRRQSVFAGHVP
jgi:hypothetical protein